MPATLRESASGVVAQQDHQVGGLDPRDPDFWPLHVAVDVGKAVV